MTRPRDIADSINRINSSAADATAVTIDSSEQVGIGTTSPAEMLHVYHATANINAIIESGDANAYLAFKDNSTTGYAHVFLGASGNDMTFFSGGSSEQMRLNSSGNVGIGTTSITSSAGWTPRMVLAETSGSPAVILKGDNSQEGSVGASNGLYIDCFGSTTGTNNNIIFRNTPSNSNFVAQERMRIDSSGKVGIGTTSTSGILNIAGNDAFEAITLRDNTAGANMFSITCAEYVGAGGNPNKLTAANSSAISFETGGSERMRISTSSPALSIGKTTFGTAGQGYTVYGNTAPQCYFNKSQSGAVNGVLFYHSDSYVGGLNYNNTNTSLVTSSDERLKDNIENSDDAGAKIDAMQVRQFDWKSTGEHQEYGFVAQELESVFAHAVHTDKEGDYKSVDYACLVPMLVKEIQSLRQRITDLENA